MTEESGFNSYQTFLFSKAPRMVLGSFLQCVPNKRLFLTMAGVYCIILPGTHSSLVQLVMTMM